MVSINHFHTDLDEELDIIRNRCAELGVRVALSDGFALGGKGAVDVARAVIEAAEDLGAKPSIVFWKVVVPLSMPGVTSGIMMVFMPTISTFAIAELLTMNNIKLFGTTIQENINNGMWNYGAALSLIMLVIIGITSLFSDSEEQSQNEGGII